MPQLAKNLLFPSPPGKVPPVDSPHQGFSFEKGLNGQNHSSSDFQHPIKDSLQQNFQLPLKFPTFTYPLTLFGKPCKVCIPFVEDFLFTQWLFSRISVFMKNAVSGGAKCFHKSNHQKS